MTKDECLSVKLQTLLRHFRTFELLVIRYSRNSNIEIAEQAVGDIVDPAVDGEGMAARPCICDGARARDIFDLFDHIELA